MAGVFLPKDDHGTQNGGEVINYPFVSEYYPARSDLRIYNISDNAAANVAVLTAIFGQLIDAE